MMNFLALGLVLTSLVTAGFFTPTPQNPKSSEDVIVKEGRRVVVVEYEKDDGNTKVLISPQDSQTSQRADGKGFASNVYDKMSERVEGVKEASSSAVDEMEKDGNQGEEILNKFRPRELVCDAYGKCKHKIASAFGRATEAAEEKAHEAAEAVSGAAGKVRDTVTHKVQETKENVKEEAGKRYEGAKETVSGKAEIVKDKVAHTAHKASDTVQETKENLNEEASRKLEGAKETVSDTARRVRRGGQKELKEILKHAREVAGDVFDYVAPRERVAPVAAVLHVMGFAVAYGMCVWITFASSYVLAGALPRQQFAMVQSQIYPVYFKAMGYSVGMALLGHVMGPSRRLSPASVVAFQGLNLASSLVMILTNLMWLEPRATKVMLERMKLEKEEGTGKEGAVVEPSKNAAVDSTAETAGRGSAGEEAAAKAQIIHLSRTLERLNSYSSLLNALTLVSLTWHLVHLSQLLYATC